jgi:hypothetical protein
MKANGVANLDADEAKTIWKTHFAKQITLSETTLMLLYRKEHLTDYTRSDKSNSSRKEISVKSHCRSL